MAKTIFLFVQPLQSNVHVLEVKIDEFSRQYSAFSKMVEFSAKRHGKSKKWWESEGKQFLSSAAFDMNTNKLWLKIAGLSTPTPAYIPSELSIFILSFKSRWMWTRYFKRTTVMVVGPWSWLNSGYHGLFTITRPGKELGRKGKEPYE